jgi:hypothetical protein
MVHSFNECEGTDSMEMLNSDNCGLDDGAMNETLLEDMLLARSSRLC